MEFDIVIATRNRQRVLPLSIPLMLSQNRLPQCLIVVDSSDNHSEVVKILDKIVSKSSVNIDMQIVQSNAGSSLQRNVGLKYVLSPIVMFPDDDALWFENVADPIMKIYETDVDELIGGVCSSESLIPPFGIFKDGKQPYRMELRDRLQHRIAKNLKPVEKRFFPDPFFAENNTIRKTQKLPSWLPEAGAVLSGPMTGFRMTFRTDLIKRYGFDEALGRYAMYEDRDASLSILNDHLIVQALKSRVFHYRVPEKRINGLSWGIMAILNRAYIICKHYLPESLERKCLLRFSYYQLARYLIQAHTKYGRQRALGAWRAIARIPILLNESKHQLAATYIRLRNECVGHDASFL